MSTVVCSCSFLVCPYPYMKILHTFSSVFSSLLVHGYLGTSTPELTAVALHCSSSMDQEPMCAFRHTLEHHGIRPGLSLSRADSYFITHSVISLSPSQSAVQLGNFILASFPLMTKEKRKHLANLLFY